MPYPRAHLVLICLVPLIGLAFWPGYFSRLADMPVATHVHGLTASAWIALLILQSWAIHRRKFLLHRIAGRGSFVVFPLFLMGGCLALHNMAKGVASGANPFIAAFGPGLGAIDAMALATFAGLYLAALRRRRTVQLHARYMLATPLLLLAPIFTRLLVEHVPALAIDGPEDMAHFVYGLHLANLFVWLLALGLFATAPRYGKPFLAVGTIVILQSIAFQWLGVTPGWRTLFASLGSSPAAMLAGIGLVAGSAIVWWGWRNARPHEVPGAVSPVVP